MRTPIHSTTLVSMPIHHPALMAEPHVDDPKVFFLDHCAKVIEGRAEAAKAMGGLVRFNFEGETYTVDLGQAKVFATPRQKDCPSEADEVGRVDLTMRSADFKPVLTGRASLVSLVRSGAARVSGDIHALAAMTILLSA